MPHQRTAGVGLATAGQSRALPIAIAVTLCLSIALTLGISSWYFFGTSRGPAPRVEEPSSVQVPRQLAPEPTPSPERASKPPAVPAPAGELPVPGGEVALGGGDTGVPLHRELVQPFSIAETEVTNAQYKEFLDETHHAAPPHWKEGTFPPGAALEPVTNVTWQDASDYCQWLSKKLGATVRLPTEAEWEMAAKGRENFSYPWGNEWKDSAAACKETRGQVHAVKSYPEGRSPSGAYDMAGNVWEWTADEARDEQGKVKTKGDVTLRIAKGGSAADSRRIISVASRYEKRPDVPNPFLGFRYVVRRDD